MHLAEKLVKREDPGALRDAFDLIRDHERKETVNGLPVTDSECFKEAHRWNVEMRKTLSRVIKGGGSEDAVELYWRSLLFDAPHSFDAYCRYLEHKRPVSAQFYVNRRKQLKPVVDALQELADGGINLLAISLPPGVGKTTLAIFFLTFLSGREPDLPNLGASHSSEFVRGVYQECLRILLPGEYCWGDIFPHVPIVGTNAKDLRIDLGAAKRFETLEFTSIGSENAGKVRARNLLYCDDLVSGIEQALSAERMESLWKSYTVDLVQRKQGNQCKELHIATRWSVNDVIGRLEEKGEGKFIRIPALNENGESNFDFPYGVGYSTEAFEKIRETMDEASWSSLYMNEPYERKGLLYPSDRLRRFTDLPENPDGIVAICDTKSTGADYCVLPVAYLYGNDVYIADVVCDNGDPGQVETELVEKLLRHGVKRARFESNAAGWKIAESVGKRVKERGGYCSIETKWSQANKATKIQVEQPWVLDHCLFKTEESLKGGEWAQYRNFLKLLSSYVQNGRNKYDDAPDAMAQLSQFVQGVGGVKAEIIRRPW